MLPRLAQFGLEIFVVDDASGEAVSRPLQKEIAKYQNVHLIQRKDNGGKGAAMISGLRTAAEHGHSHAISLDADGQHDPAAIPELLKRSQALPDSLFSGRPVFGEDIPASRLYGRMLTNYLVQFVTASRMVRDAMCGLRVYPLAHVLPLCDAIGYRTRMEFDVEILVRACWAGLDVQTMDTAVTYPQDGESHFNLIADNVRLVAMHALLIIGGLVRLPRTLWRRLSRRMATQ
jgi:glycosyltransferase involved in cell wall biosynthesis